MFQPRWILYLSRPSFLWLPVVILKFVAAHWLPTLWNGEIQKKSTLENSHVRRGGAPKGNSSSNPSVSGHIPVIRGVPHLPRIFGSKKQHCSVFRSLFKAIWPVNNGHFNEQCPVLCGLIQRWCFRNPANQLVSSLSQYLRRILYSIFFRWLQDRWISQHQQLARLVADLKGFKGRRNALADDRRKLSASNSLIEKLQQLNLW